MQCAEVDYINTFTDTQTHTYISEVGNKCWRMQLIFVCVKGDDWCVSVFTLGNNIRHKCHSIEYTCGEQAEIPSAIFATCISCTLTTRICCYSCKCDMEFIRRCWWWWRDGRVREKEDELFVWIVVVVYYELACVCIHIGLHPTDNVYSCCIRSSRFIYILHKAND